MLLIFHHFTNKKSVILPFSNILYIQEHDAGGSVIYTKILNESDGSQRKFRSQESPIELYKSVKPDLKLGDGIFSAL